MRFRPALTTPLIALCLSWPVASFAADKPVNFAREVLPVLSEKCFVCHGPDTRKKDLVRLDSFEAATKDLDGYKAIDPDDLKESELLFRIKDTADPMPPKKFDKPLTDAERELLERWVMQGGKYAKHWAFAKPEKQQPPAIKGAANPIDAFLLGPIKERKQDFAAAADRRTLARRVALVLTGLPPDPQLLDQFLADKSPKALDKLVNALFQDDRYGEHQARYWLDAVRYGDTHGLHLDNKRGIYPYRDWTIKAFNDNLPLDQFIIWQMAGDMLENPTLEQLVATGFIRMNPSTAEGGVIPAEFQAKNSFDRTETVGTVLLGMSFICARCHTHKYDPLTQTEYYELFAFFNNTAESPLDGNKYEYKPVIKAPANLAAWNTWHTLEQERDKFLQTAKSSITAELAKPQSDQLVSLSAPDLLKRLADAKSPIAKLQAQAKAIADKIAKTQAGFVPTLVAKELPNRRATRFLDRGEYHLPVGDPLQPDVPAVMGEFPKDTPRNRLGLAQWLTSRDHPLVARVLVNRIWQRVFGVGLVRTPEEFGLQGQQPTHPELLDWLAMELHDSGWDLQHMLRLMMTSRAFQQNSAYRQGVDDPENRLFARGPSYRMDAEVIRDVALWAGGLLAPEMGGEGIKPYQPAGMWKALAHPASNTKQYVADKGAKLYRRTIYVYWKRTSPHPMMMLFDAPSRESSCVRRSRTNTPLQSLGLLNEIQRTEMARAFAQRLLKERKSDSDRLDLLFTLLASRTPTDKERSACEGLLAAMRDRYGNEKAQAIEFLSVGETPRDESLDVIDLAAWSQLTITVLASDIALLLY